MSDLQERLDKLRINYSKSSLGKSDVHKDPVEQFALWFDQGAEVQLPDLNVVHLSTSHQGQPSSRVVLLRSFDNDGFVFFTNYNSEKGQHITRNPKVALTFFWWQLERQVRIEGQARKVARAVSTAYFASRPRESQIGAWASAQSEQIIDREMLDAKYLEMENRFEGEEVPCPEHWGGYVVVPERIEFWQGRDSRLHDRLEYQKAGNNWQLRRVQP